jgi:hypothetical protein
MIVSQIYRELSVQVENSEKLQYSFNACKKKKIPIILINTLLLHFPLLALTDGQNDRQRDKLILVGLGNLWLQQVNTSRGFECSQKNYPFWQYTVFYIFLYGV